MEVALELQDPTYAQSVPTGSLLNATGNGADKWKALDYAGLASAFYLGIALQPFFSDINTDNPDLSGARDAGTKTVVSGKAPDSDPISFAGTGIAYWQAVYSGDGNNRPAQTPCLPVTVTNNGTIAILANNGAAGNQFFSLSVGAVSNNFFQNNGTALIGLVGGNNNTARNFVLLV